MHIGFFSPKGGQGTSTVACAVALSLQTPTLLVDRRGDCAGILGVPEGGGVVNDNLRLESGNDARLYVNPDTTVIYDCGAKPLPRLDRTILVIRPCYLAIARAVRDSVKADGYILVKEPALARALSEKDITPALKMPLIASVDITPTIARTIDAGLFAMRPLDLEWSAVTAAFAKEVVR